MGLRQQQSEFARAVGKLLTYVYAQGYECTLGDTYPGKWKHSPNGQHPKGLAIDINLFRDGHYLQRTEDHAACGLYWESIGGSWGGRFGDGNHYSWGEA